MKLTLSLTILLLFVVSSNAQWRPIKAKEYKKIFEFAVDKTNDAFPFVFTVTTDFIEKGKIVSTVKDVDERESMERERSTRTTVARGSTTNKYQIRVGLGNVFCSDDGVSWTPPSPYECYGPVSFYGPRNPKSIAFSVTEKSVEGKKVKVYREYSVFAPLKPTGKKDFRESVSMIDSRGFFINVVDTEGTLAPRKVTLIRKQSWDGKTKIKPVVPPIR